MPHRREPNEARTEASVDFEIVVSKKPHLFVAAQFSLEPNLGCAAHDSIRVDLGRWVQLWQQSRVVKQVLDTVDWFWERLELGDEAVELGGHVDFRQ